MAELVERSLAALDEALANLRKVAVLQRCTKQLSQQEADLVQRLQQAVITHVTAFTDSSNPKILPLLERHLEALVEELLRLLRGGRVEALQFVESYAEAAAEEYFPLEPLLHAYRYCAKVLVQQFSEVLTRGGGKEQALAISAAADFLLEFVDALSSTAAEHHVDRSRLLADVASDERSELLSILLGGYDESDRRVSRVLRDAGYQDRRLAFCVVLAQSIDPTEMHNPARARRLADYIDRLLERIPGKRLVDIHRNKVTIVFSHRRRLSGWSAPEAPLARRVAEELLKIGPAARTGVSNDVASTSQIPAAYRQASLAFDVSSVGHRVVQFSDIPLQQLLQHFAGEEFQRVIPAWASAFYEADDQAKGQLTQTLRAYADQNMNVLKTAKQLKVHPNTVYARFDKIVLVTGRDARLFQALSELLIVGDCRSRGEPAPR